MKTLQLFIGALFLLLCLTSCNDLLTKDLDIEDDFGYEKKMAISGSLTAENDELVLLVAENQSIVDPINEVRFINDATINLLKDGDVVSTFIQDDNNYYRADLSSIDLWEGEFTVEASNSEFGLVTGTSTLPQQVPLSNLDIDETQSGGDIFEETENYLLSFEIDDPAEDNFYRIEVFAEVIDTFISEQQDTFIDSYVIYPDIFSTDQSGTSTWNDGFLITDNLFNGEKYTMSLNMSIYSWSTKGNSFEPEDFTIYWYTMSEELFNFKRSFQQYQEASDFGPFQEPTSIYSNIENGAGYFGCENRAVYKIQ